LRELTYKKRRKKEEKEEKKRSFDYQCVLVVNQMRDDLDKRGNTQESIHLLHDVGRLGCKVYKNKKIN